MIGKSLILSLLTSVSLYCNAEILDRTMFSINILGGWTSSVDTVSKVADGWGKIVTINPKKGNGELKLQAFTAPKKVDMGVLRNLTNVNESIEMDRLEWNGISGYHHSYVENDIYYKQWWLATGKTVLLATYSSKVEIQSDLSEMIDDMIGSIKMGRPH